MIAPTSDEWFVIRKRDTEPIELYPFHSESEANALYDIASAQWSETFVVRVVRGPKILPSPPSTELLQTRPISSEQTRWRQCGVLFSVEHVCTGDATHGQYDSGPMVCEAFVEVHKKLYPHVADSWRFAGRLEETGDWRPLTVPKTKERG